jgi:predicted MFS family arabinose efflux permease
LLSPRLQIGSRLTPLLDALAVPAFRRYYTGQTISVTASWMQILAEAWLVIQLRGGALQLGWLMACSSLPALLFSIHAGVLADAVDKRRLMVLTQAASAVISFVLAVLVWTSAMRLWILYLLSGASGMALAVETPARQTMVFEMVGSKRARGALVLSAISLSGGRFVGPGIVALVLTLQHSQNLGFCFFVNGLSFILVIYVLMRLPWEQVKVAARGVDRRGQAAKAGLAYVWKVTHLRWMVIALILVGALSINFQVFMPLVDHVWFHKGAQGFALLSAAFGVGALAGAIIGAFGVSAASWVGRAAFALGVFLGVAAFTRLWAAQVILFGAVGLATVCLLTTTNVALQENSDPAFRGRTVALYSLAVTGTTPIGSPIIGLVAERAGLAAAMAVASGAAILGGATLAMSNRSQNAGRDVRQGTRSVGGDGR